MRKREEKERSKKVYETRKRMSTGICTARENCTRRQAHTQTRRWSPGQQHPGQTTGPGTGEPLRDWRDWARWEEGGHRKQGSGGVRGGGGGLQVLLALAPFIQCHHLSPNQVTKELLTVPSVPERAWKRCPGTTRAAP